MNKSIVKYFLILILGVSIGWGASNVSSELADIETALVEAKDQIGVLGFLETKEKSDLICFETRMVLPALHEARAVLNANQILHLVKPSLIKRAKETEYHMQEYLKKMTNSVCKGAPYFVNETLAELGYDL